MNNETDKLKLSKYNYLDIEQQYLEDLVLRIRESGKAKKEFRSYFQTNTLLFLEKRTKKYERKTKNYAYVVPNIYWVNNTEKIAELITELVLKAIERGHFDIYDEDGNILLDKKGRPKTEGLAANLWRKMEFTFKDLLNKKVNNYFTYLDDDIPYEKKMLDLMEEISGSSEGPYLLKNSEVTKKKAKKELDRYLQGQELINFMREQAIDNSNKGEDYIDKILFQEMNEEISSIIKLCLKQLKSKQLTGVRLILRDIFRKMALNKKCPELLPTIAQD